MGQDPVRARPEYAAFELTIERAEARDGKRVVRGVANTFSVMRSRRIIHPQAIEDWLKRAPGASVPLLAQHGYVEGFATIGQVTGLSVDRERGLLFEARLAAGAPHADTAWALIEQRVLRGVSLGWSSRQARWVTDQDKDLDPWFAQKLKDAGLNEAFAFLDLELVEISLVDVPDDAGALLAARLDPRLRGNDGASGSADERLVAAAVNAARETTTKLMADFAHGLENRLCEVIETRLADLGAAYSPDELGVADAPSEAERADGDPAAGGEPASARAWLAGPLERLQAALERL